MMINSNRSMTFVVFRNWKTSNKSEKRRKLDWDMKGLRNWTNNIFRFCSPVLGTLGNACPDLTVTWLRLETTFLHIHLFIQRSMQQFKLEEIAPCIAKVLSSTQAILESNQYYNVNKILQKLPDRFWRFGWTIHDIWQFFFQSRKVWKRLVKHEDRAHISWERPHFWSCAEVNQP